MIIDVEGNLAGPLFFVLNELIVKIIKLRKFFVERHKLLIGQIALNLFMVPYFQRRAEECIGRLKIYEDFISGMQCKIYSFQSCCL